MPRIPSFRQTVDEALTFDITLLKNKGFLKLNVDIFNGSCTWSRNGNKTASVGYSIRSIHEDLKRLNFNYLNREEKVSYPVDIVAVPTNLGKGKRWYFVCPSTGRRCMKLISPIGCKYFLHRSAFPKMIYDTQKQSKGYRRLNKLYGVFFELDRLDEELYKKYRKTHYRGNPTPLMKKVLKKQAEIEKIDIREYELALLA